MLSVFLFWLAVVELLIVVVSVAEFAIGNRSIRSLKNAAPISRHTLPKISVITAARNEARNIEEALLSVLHQDYANLEVIVVDDRSSDETGAILDRMAAANRRLRVVHVTELPRGWLGKNHALYRGAERATGDWLLFSDADVVMEPTTVSRGIRFALDERLDHLAVTPHVAMSGLLLNMVAGAFTLFFGIYAKPWKARDPKSSRHIGIGAFNLVRAEVYRAVGGHQSIAMRPDDDMKLGKLIKKAGYRQDVVLGDGLITVEWYASVGELMRGLEKNSFAGVEYNFGLVILSFFAMLAMYVWPVFALAFTSGVTRLLNVAILLGLAAGYADNASFHGMKRWHCFALPLSALIFGFIILRATLKTILNDGINWRGTHYPLAELKANKV